MERTERVYRHHDERSASAPSGGLALPVSGLQKRRGGCLSGLHRRTMRVETPNGQRSNRRTRSPRTGDHDSHGWRGAWRLKIQGSKHQSPGQVVSAVADIVVSAADEIPGQLWLTLSRKDIQKREFLVLTNCGTPTSICPNPEPNAQTPDGGRSSVPQKPEAGSSKG